MDNRSPLDKLKNILYSGWGQNPPQYAATPELPAAPMALPNDGMQGAELDNYVKNVNTGPVATTGENPAANADRDSNIFARVSDQYKNQQLKGNVGETEPVLGATGSNSGRSPAKSPSLLDSLIPSAAAAEVKPRDVYGNELNDAALKAAQDHKTKMNMWTNIGRGTNQMLGGATNTKVSNEALDAIDKDGDQFEKDILTRREGKDKELSREKMMKGLEDDDAMRDPNSAISISLREGAKLAGMTVPANVSGKMLHDSGLNLGTLLNARMAAEARKDAARLSAEARKDARDEKLEQKRKLSDKQVSVVAQYDKAIDSMKNIAKEKMNWDTGKMSFAANMASGLVGLDDADKTAFKSQVQDFVAQYIKDLSGTAASDKERAFLQKNIPSVYDNDATFSAKSEKVIKKLESLREVELGLFEKQGKNVSEFKLEKSSNTGTHPPGTIVNVKGKRYKVGADGDSLEEI